MLNLVAMIAGAAMMAPPPADAMIRRQPDVAANFDTTRFKCAGGRDLLVSFSSGESKFVAVVDAGEGAYTLPVIPFEGETPKVTWSDGIHTLVWNVGVQLMFMDGPKHLDCSRGMDHEH